MSYYGRVENPFRDMLGFIMRRPVPETLVPDQCYDSSDARIDQHKLQDWVGTHLPKEIRWSTAIGLIEAVDKIVYEAEANANIDPFPLQALPSKGRDSQK
jgi:hypothetical protein